MSERRRAGLVLALVALGGCAVAVLAQVSENPKDPIGIQIPYRLVHLVGSRDVKQEGTSAQLRSSDTFLFFQLGRDLLHRQFMLKHGIYGQAGAMSVPLYSGLPETNAPVHGLPARFARDHSASCGMCHSSLYREPSAGQTIASSGGLGRNTPHFYGAGLVEMLGEQVTILVLRQYDKNGDGLIGRDEVAGPSPVRIETEPGGGTVDFGDLSPGPDGVPRLNTVFRVWYAGAQGHVIPDAFSLNDRRVAAFGFVMQPFGWGRGRTKVNGLDVSQGGESSSLREFYTVAADFHMGLQAYDPVQQGERPEVSGFGGLTRVSLNGARQHDFGGSVDRGRKRSATGVSLDDPDGDGVLNELTEGDVDAVEFYLLHTPPPAVRATATSEQGRAVLARVGCLRCHVEDWQLKPRDEKLGLTGDRRLFHLETSPRADADGSIELTGKLVRSYRTLPSGERVPNGGGFTIERVYSDFKHWDIGPAYYERRFDGSLQKEHRTAPLWGAGSSAPYGHTGQYMTLDDAILSHQGAAAAESAAYTALGPEDRRLLLEYLRSLVLYSTDEIPADVDGDGQIAGDFTVAGQKVGYERFEARFLFARPRRDTSLGDTVRYNGRSVPLLLVENIDEAYGFGLRFRVDADQNGFPDVLDPPTQEKGGSNEPSHP